MSLLFRKPPLQMLTPADGTAPRSGKTEEAKVASFRFDRHDSNKLHMGTATSTYFHTAFC